MYNSLGDVSCIEVHEHDSVKVYLLPANSNQLIEGEAEEVILPGDVAEETVVVTTTEVEGDRELELIDPQGQEIDVFSTIELTGNEGLQQALEDTTPVVVTEDTAPTEVVGTEDTNVDMELREEAFSQSYIALVPDSRSDCDSDNSNPSQKELTKREKDRLYKRELRKNPEFRAKEKLSAKQRMKDRRKDPYYREIERKKDAERRRLARQHNVEARQREKERDKKYRRELRKKETELELAKNNICDNPSDSTLTVSNCFTALDWTVVSGCQTETVVKYDENVDYQDYVNKSNFEDLSS